MVSFTPLLLPYLITSSQQESIVKVISNSSSISSEEVVKTFGETLSLPTGNSLNVRLTVSSLPGGHGGAYNTWVQAELMNSNKVIGHWIAHCSDAKILLENRTGEIGVPQSGLLRKLGSVLTRTYKSSLNRTATIPELAAEVPTITEAEVGRVTLWRPELGGNIEPNEVNNLRFSPGQKFRVQLRTSTSYRVQMALIKPDGKFHSAYAPEIPPVTQPEAWTLLPTDSTIGFGGTQQFGAWKLILLLEPTNSNTNPDTSPIQGGIVRQISEDSTPTNKRLCTDLTEAWLTNTLKDWRRYEIKLDVKAGS